MSNLENVLKSRVLCLDGAMGTMIQRYNLAEEDFRGRLPLRPGIRVRGANDLLVLTRPDVITEIHDDYIKAGADIIETDSFNANAISMRDYGLENMVAFSDTICIIINCYSCRHSDVSGIVCQSFSFNFEWSYECNLA